MEGDVQYQNLPTGLLYLDNEKWKNEKLEVLMKNGTILQDFSKNIYYKHFIS